MTFRLASCAVAVTVQIAAALRAESPLREPPAFFLVTTGPRMVLSARLLSLFRHLICSSNRISLMFSQVKAVAYVSATMA